MSIEMSLELSDGLSIEDIKAILFSCGATLVEEDTDKSLVFFSDSKMNAWIDPSGMNTSVRAMGISSTNWSVKYRILFRLFGNKYDECKRDFDCTIRKIAKNGNVYFIAAYQFEDIYAIRDEGGLRFF